MRLLVVLRTGANMGADVLQKAQRRILQACLPLGGQVDSYLYGSEADLMAVSATTLSGTVYTQAVDFTSPCAVAKELEDLVRQNGYSGVVLAADSQANAIAVLLAMNCGFPCVTDVCGISSEGGAPQFHKLVYGNNLTAQYPAAFPFVISERMATIPRGEPGAPAVYQTLPACPRPSHLLMQEELSTARKRIDSPVLIAAGMGVTSRETLGRIRTFARQNGFDFGVTRPVAMRGWADIDEIIGVSGTIYSPRVTVTLGISGAAAFFVGIERSDYILSVNTNPQATIAAQSDAIIADDCEQVLGSLFSTLEPYRVGTRHA